MAVMVTVEEPVAAVELAVNVRVEDPEPGATIDDGLKLAVTPDGSPAADKDSAELKPPDIAVVAVELTELPCVSETDDGDTVIEKSGVAAAVTDSERLA